MWLNWLRAWKRQQELTLRGRTERRRPRRKSTVRLHLEPLEDRTVPTIVFDPQFGAETVIPQEIAGGLNSPPLFIEFWGSYWQNGSGPQQLQKILTSAQKLTSSPYWSGLIQYGDSGVDS